jgi:hypothetical protein
MARGDHICVRRWRGLYTHHGIDLGNGQVVHLSGEPLRLRDARVCVVSMDDFTQGQPVRVLRHKDADRPPEEVATAALSHLGERGYHLWHNNCEHFASYCATGERRSEQVTFAGKVLKTAAAATAGAAAAAITVIVVMKQASAGKGTQRRAAHTRQRRTKA